MASTLAADLPNCAKDCLNTTTQSQSTCSGLDVRCLCTSSDYVDKWACCVSTSCSDDDQQSAIKINKEICQAVGVTFPNFVGCSSNVSTAVSQAIASASSMASGAAASGTSGGPKTSTVASIQPGVQLPTTSTIATFAGKSVLTGSCTQPQFALVTMGNGGNFLEYPWLGCSYLFPECCPFDLRVGGQLSVCPADYTTTSGGCCPSGYSIYTSEIAGATPCYTTPILPLVPPDATSNAAVSIINTQLFALKYSLVPKHHSSFPTGAIAGVAVGGFAALAILLGFVFFFVRRRRIAGHRARAKDGNVSTTSASESTFAGPKGRGPLTHMSSNQPSELPSPQSATLPDTPLWMTMPPVPPLKPRAPLGPPKELEGDTYMHAHHPANSISATAEADSERDREGFKETSPQAPFKGDAFSGSVMGAAAVDDGEREAVESPVLGRKEGV
ncbi:MAG: hypothetical protein Q9217_006051 [Psora testacea]